MTETPSESLPGCESGMIDRILYAAEFGSHVAWVVTGAEPADGATTIALMLTRALAARKKDVILVDANLRHPEIHRRAEVEVAPGLVQVLKRECSVDSVVQRASGNLDGGNVQLISAGEIAPDPVELLRAPEMEVFLADLKRRFEFTLVDCPAVRSAPDAIRLAGLVDGVVLVLRAGSTRRRAAQEAKELLANAGANIVGAVLNDYHDFVPQFMRRWL